MRTTIRLDTVLLSEIKKIAADERRSLTSVIDESLRESLARRRDSPKRAPVKLPRFRGGGVLPGVDLDDSADLLERMERTDARNASS
jgi:hypothetical protein